MSDPTNAGAHSSRTTSRRALLRATAGGALAVAAATTGMPPRAAHAQNPLPPQVRAIMGAPQFDLARWFLYVADRATGETHYALNADDLVLLASTTKLWSTGAALDAYGGAARRPDSRGQRRPDDGRARHPRWPHRLHPVRPRRRQRQSPRHPDAAGPAR